MKTKHILISALLLTIGFITGRSLFTPTPATPQEVPTEASQASAWTCSMHPQIQQSEPSDCPICGMDLIPLVDESADDAGPRELRMSTASRALAKIQTSPVRRQQPNYEIRLVGQLARDASKVKSLTARFPARVEKLAVDAIGIAVQPGQTLATIYSPELLSAQGELLAAYQRDPEGRLTQAAKEKLLLWDLSPDQINALLENGQIREKFELHSPIAGIVVTKQINEGDYLKTGQPLYTIVDLSQLWLHLNAYESDLAWLEVGQHVQFTVKSFPGQSFHGTIELIEPEIDSKTRTVPIRVIVPNPEQRLKPGMFASATVMAPGKSVGETPLLVASSAVLRTGKRAVVYIEKPDTKRPTFEGREIVLGPRAGDHFVVAEGLSEGERIVTHGAFKIDSALQIQAKPSMMNPSTEPHAQPPAMPTELKIPTHQAVQILPIYLKLQSALAADNLAAAQTQTRAMMRLTGHSGALPTLLHSMLAAESLDALRKPHFETLSNALIAATQAAPTAFEGELFIMHCPMVYGDHGADWLQADQPLKNPYFGAMMLHCGEVKKKIKPEEN
jgi:Cu(I)/Ag(I) efflux system membrane fusion protein